MEACQPSFLKLGSVQYIVVAPLFSLNSTLQRTQVAYSKVNFLLKN